MGIFDRFKKKQPNINTENLLEQLLEKAAKDPSVRNDFYKNLIESDLVTISEPTGLPHGETVLKQNTSIKIAAFNDSKIPVFTSTQRIFDKGVIKEQVNYVQMKARAVFEITKGATLLLNPYSDYGKELLPQEIENLLAGTIHHAGTHTIVVPKDTTVRIGQPSVYPTHIVEALKHLFVQEDAVIAAYLGWIHYPDSIDPPHYIFGIDATVDSDRLNDRAGAVAQQFFKTGEFVDIISLNGDLGVVAYLKSTEPFYKKGI